MDLTRPEVRWNILLYLNVWERKDLTLTRTQYEEV